MTNADKFLKDGITGNEIFNLAQELGVYLTVNCKASYVFASDINLFFQQPRTPTLTEDERVILRNIDIKNYDIIGKNGLGVTFITSTKDSDKFIWVGDVFAKKLFQFIKERRRISDRGATEMQCLVCGEEFVPKSKIHKYCSIKCRIKVARAIYKKYNYQNKKKRVLKRVVERRKI